jgi:hypothetical protein
MTTPMSPRDPDAILAAWLEEGPAQLPETTRRAIAVDLRTTRQNRRVLDVPWRPNTMNPFARLAAVAAVIVIVAGGAVYLLQPGNQGVGGPPASPSPSVAPTRPTVSASPELSWETFTSDRFGYRIDVPTGWIHSAPIDDLPDELYPGDERDLADRWDVPVNRTPYLIVSRYDPAPAETVDAWLARDSALLEDACDVTEHPQSEVGGRPATRRTYLCPGGGAGDVVLLEHAGSVYGVEMGGAPRDAASMSEILDHVLSSFTFTD